MTIIVVSVVVVVAAVVVVIVVAVAATIGTGPISLLPALPPRAHLRYPSHLPKPFLKSYNTTGIADSVSVMRAQSCNLKP